jgi:hypothetical protein
MSSQRIAGAGLALFLSGALSVSLYGQTAQEYRDRISRLLPLLEEARLAERARADSLRTVVDTQRIGLLTVVSKPTHSVYVAEAMRRAWDEMSPALGSDPALDVGLTFYAEPRDDPVPAYGLFSDDLYAVRYVADAGPAALARTLVVLIRQHLARILDPSGELLGGLNFQPLEKETRERLYRLMVTRPSSAVRRCYLGEIAACRDVLAISEIGDPLNVWYDSNDWRALVESRRWGSRPAADLTLCLEGQLDEACLTVLRTVPARSLAPLPGDARQLLVDVAVDLGGEGAYRRLLAPGDLKLETRLALAAGVDSDSLISAWRMAMLAARPASPAVPRRSTWATFLWILVFGILGLRSTRWRSS